MATIIGSHRIIKISYCMWTRGAGIQHNMDVISNTLLATLKELTGTPPGESDQGTDRWPHIHTAPMLWVIITNNKCSSTLDFKFAHLYICSAITIPDTPPIPLYWETSAVGVHLDSSWNSNDAQLHAQCKHISKLQMAFIFALLSR